MTLLERIQRVQHASKYIIPSRELVMVAPGVYMSSFMHPRSLEFLQLVGIKSLLFCTPRHPLRYESEQVRDFILSANFRYCSVPKAKNPGKIVLTQGVAKLALEACHFRHCWSVLADGCSQFVLGAPTPLLIAGFDGIESVALLVACLRKLQCWDFSSIQAELQRSLTTDVDAIHIRFIHEFCSLAPLTVSGALKSKIKHDRDETGKKEKQDESSQAILSLPSASEIPDWLWYGFKSPSALLFGGDYDRDDLTEREMNWHPNMRIVFKPEKNQTQSTGAPADADEDEHDPLPTPRCTSSANSPPRTEYYTAPVSSSASSTDG